MDTGRIDNGDQGHQGADGQHHKEDPHQHGRRGDELGNALIEALAHGVHVVGDTGEDLAHGTGLKVFHGHPVDLFRDIPPHPVADLLGNPGHDPTLEKGEGGADQIQAQQQEQDAADLVKVNAAGALDLGHQAVEQLGGGVAQDLGPQHREEGPRHGKEHHHPHSGLVFPNIGQQAEDCPPEIPGLLAGHHPAAGAMGPPPDRSGRYMLFVVHAPAPPNSASESCDRAIS